MYASGSFYQEVMDVEGGFASWSTMVNEKMDEIDSLESAVAGKFSTPTGSTSQYIRGDGSLATFPSIPTQYTDELAQDAVGGILSAEFVYNDAANTISLRDYSISAPTFNSATTATQLSSTRKAIVLYNFDASVNISLLAGQSITATLRYADNSGMSTNVVVLDSMTTSNSGVLGLTQTNTLKLGGIIPAGKYRQVTFASSGSPTLPNALKSGQEVLI